MEDNMQLLLFDNPNNIELFCPHCLQQSNFYKNEDFTPLMIYGLCNVKNATLLLT